MVLSNKGLNRLKLITEDSHGIVILPELRALIARLEAAEAVIHTTDYESGLYDQDIYEAWRKVAGK